MSNEHSTKRAEMPVDDANGSEKRLSAADVYCWEDPDFKENPTDMKFFRASDNIAHDCGADPKARFPESLKKELISLGAVRPETPKGKGREIAQSNPDNPLGITSRKQGFYVPLRRAVLNVLKDASYAVSVSSNSDAEATETPPEPSVNRDVVVEGMAQVTPTAAESSAAFAITRKPAHLQRNHAIDKAQVLQALVNLQCSETVVAALSYVGMGWSVLPWRVIEGEDGKPRKVPCIKEWNSGGAYSDLLTIPKVFDDGKFGFKGRFYDKQLGIACGATNAGYELVVLDIDVKNGKNGWYAVKALMDKFGSLPNTLTQLTPSGGFHYLFKVPNGTGIYRTVNAFKELGATLDTMEHEKETDRGGGLDVLGFGGYIGASPSVGANGEQYKWLNDVPIAPLPDDWVEAFKVECGKDKVRNPKSVPAIVFDEEAEPLSPRDVADIRSVIGAHSFGIQPIIDVDGNQSWFNIGAALKRYGRVGYELFLDASKNSKYWDEEECAKTWERYDGQMTKASIFGAAKAHNPEWVNPSTRCAQATVAAQKAAEDAQRDKLFGTMPAHAVDNPNLGGVDKFPDVASLREKITTDGVAARQKFADGNLTHPNSAKWLALGLLNDDADKAVEYQRLHPNTSEGTPRRLVVNGKVDLKVFTYTAVMHIAGEVLLMMDKLEGGFAGLSKASREKLTDLICDLFKPMPIGAKWKELEANTPTLNLRKTIETAVSKVKDHSTVKPPHSGAMQRSKVSVPSNGVADAVSAPVAPVETAAPVAPVAVQNTGFDILNPPICLGGTAPNPEPHVIHNVSANTVSAPGAPVAGETAIGGVVEESDEKESPVDRLYRLAKKEFRRKWVYDPIAKAVYAPNGSGTYTRLDNDAVEREITRLKDTYGVSVRGFNDIVSARRLLEGHLDLVEWSAARHLLPFKNTVYDTEQNEKLPYDLCPKFNWQLPYDLDPRATCPVFDGFILKAVNYDPDVVKTLRAFMRCLIAGDYSVKKYVELSGPSDSGKTQYMNTCVALVGRENAVSSTLKTLEDKQFETRRFYGKRLVTFPDQNRFYGDSQVFRNLTGGDAIRNEGKGVDAGDDYVFEGLVIVTANDWMNPKNNGGAIMKRRIPVEFPTAATADEIAKYAKHKGIANYIATHEMPGVMNWVLGMSLEDAQAQLRKPDAKTRALNEKVEHDNSTVLSWLQENAARCERGEESPVGKCVPAMYNSTTGDKMNTQPRDYGLFADFCDYCKGIGQVAMNRINFTKEIASVCRQRGVTVEYVKERLRNGNYNQHILTGVRLRKDTDEVEFFG